MDQIPFIWNIYILHMPSVLKQYLRNHANQWKYLLNPMFTNNTIKLQPYLNDVNKKVDLYMLESVVFCIHLFSNLSPRMQMR